MSKEIFVAFATQKGGIGKSTVTALAASYPHNVKGYNVAVVDCDDPQHSIHGLRGTRNGAIDSSTYSRLSLATISAGSKRMPIPSSRAMR